MLSTHFPPEGERKIIKAESNLQWFHSGMQACDVRGFLIACAAMTPRTWDYHNRVMGFFRRNMKLSSYVNMQTVQWKVKRPKWFPHSRDTAWWSVCCGLPESMFAEWESIPGLLLLLSAGDDPALMHLRWNSSVNLRNLEYLWALKPLKTSCSSNLLF